MKRLRLSLWISGIAVLVLVGTVFVSTSRAGYETASFELVKKDGSFEIRDYAPHLVVSTPMKGGEQGGSFGRLFKYISGENAADQKIAMTTPVFMPASGDGALGEMQFVVPAAIAKAGAPAPADPTVKLSKMSGGKYAVIRYRGRSGAEDRAAKLAELRERIAKEGLESVGAPVYAGYDPPWTPASMRRNEVLLKLK
jgi:DNA gyrase inhibitor GyrI